MRDTISSVSWFYLMAAIWLVTLAVSAIGLLGPMAAVYEAVDAGPVMRAVITMGIALATATVAAGAAWYHVRARRHPEAGRSADDLDGAAPAGSFAADRASVRS
jgi:hypothetical protein